MTNDEPSEKRFKNLSAERVRLMLHTGQIPSEWTTPAIEWLADYDLEERSRNDASQALQERLALRASKDARSANIAATVATIVSMIGAVIGLLAWLYPRAPHP